MAIRWGHCRQYISIISQEIYPTLTDQRAPLLSCQHLAERAILAARNDTVDNLNAQLLATMRGELFASYSADKIINQENADNYASECLNTINLSSLPPHLLKLKVGAAVILLRNLSPSTGMSNGTRLHVVRISQRVIEWSDSQTCWALSYGAGIHP